MRLWSIHPQYLDPAGLTAGWREGLLAKHVLEGKTKGYRNHPQLVRFKNSDDSILYINAFLTQIYKESINREYSYDFTKIVLIEPETITNLTVTSGQLAYEIEHLKNKLERRKPDFLSKLLIDIEEQKVKTHPLFSVIDGGIEEWEIIQ